MYKRQYIDFGGESALPLIDKYDNVIVVQTFSKSRSLAGSRIGFAISNPTLIKYLNDVKYSFNSYTMDRICLLYTSSGIMHIDKGEFNYAMSILKSNNGNPDACNRYTLSLIHI